jgi:TonB family protein
MGQTGTVVVHLRVGADGGLQHCMLHHSSGFKVLDHAAEQLVRSVARHWPCRWRPAALRTCAFPSFMS